MRLFYARRHAPALSQIKHASASTPPAQSRPFARSSRRTPRLRQDSVQPGGGELFLTTKGAKHAKDAQSASASLDEQGADCLGAARPFVCFVLLVVPRHLLPAMSRALCIWDVERS